MWLLTRYHGNIKTALPILLFLVQLAVNVYAFPPPPGNCKVGPHEDWTEVEGWVWSRICEGEIADLNKYFDRELDPNSDKGWDEVKRTVSPKFIESVLLHKPWAPAIPRTGIVISGALFKEPLILHYSRIEFPFSFINSRFLGKVNFMYSEIRKNLGFSNSYFNDELNLKAIKIGGDLYLNDGAEFIDIDLERAQIGGILDMDNAKVSGTLYMNSIHIKQDAYLSDMEKDLRSEFNKLEMPGANIGGEAMLRGAKITHPPFMAFINVGTDLFIETSEFKDSGDVVDMRYAKIGGNLNINDAVNIPGINLTGAHIKGELNLSMEGWEPTWQDDAILILRNVSADTLQDTKDAWPQHLELDGFIYRRFGGADLNTNLINRKAKWYKEWLQRDKPYTPQPYEQLSGLLRQAGHIDLANDILFESRERARGRLLSNFNLKAWFWQTILKWMIGYGYGIGYFRSLIWILGMVLLGKHLLKKTGQNVVSPKEGEPPIRLGFYYSLDMLLPIIRLREKHYEVDLRGWVRTYFYFHQIMGYVLASFIIAGLSGITR